MREKLILRHSATVFTASVLARPGTPSSKMWPPVSRPISSRSTMTSWPTTRFATSRVMVCVSTASFVLAVRVVISETLPLPASRSAPYLERRVPATPSPPCDPIARTLAPAQLGETEQRCLAHALVGVPRQFNEQLRHVRVTRQPEEFRRGGDHFRHLALDSGLQQLHRALAGGPHGCTIRFAQLRRRVQIRVHDRPRRHGAQRADRIHEMRALGGRHAGLTQPRHHTLHYSLIRKRPRHRSDRFLDFGILNPAE